MSSGIGAYCSSTSTSTRVLVPPSSSSFFFTLPTFTPAIRTSASAASVGGLRHGDLEAVALRAQRDRATEGEPEEQQHAERTTA